jgi:hypothetical protein
MTRLTERSGDLFAAGILFSIGAFAIIVSRFMPSGRFDEVGPGVFPCILGVILCGASLGIGVKSYCQSEKYKEVSISHRDSWAIVAGTLVMAFLFKPFGAIPVLGLYVLFLLMLLSDLGWVKSIFFAAIAAVATYFFFDVLLGIPLSGGIIY